MSQSLSWRAVIGYGCGDMANNFAFAMGALFLLSYYTDVAGVGAAAAGAMLLSVRILDAFIDVIAGRVVDKTNTRWGKFRPYLVFGALPLMLCSILVFSVPTDWSHGGKVLYAYATYIALNICYSFVNIPYGSLATVMTQDPASRAKLGMARSIGAGLTFVLISFVISPRLSSSTPAELQTLYTQLTLVLAVVGIALYLFCFACTREVVQRQVAQPSFRESLGTLRRNRPLFMLCVCALCTLGASFSVSASTIFYARYILNDVSLLALFVAIQTLLGMLLAAPSVPFLVRRLGKRNTFLAGLLLAALGYLLMFFMASLPGVLISLVVTTLGLYTSMTVMWALEADTVEYGEWCTGVRIEGLTYSLFSFTRKCGQAIGGSIPAFILGYSGYVANSATQSPSALLSIKLCMTLIPAILVLAGFLIMFFYPLTDARFAEIIGEIKQRKIQSEGGVITP